MPIWWKTMVKMVIWQLILQATQPIVSLNLKAQKTLWDGQYRLFQEKAKPKTQEVN